MNSTEDTIDIEIALIKNELGAEVGFEADAMLKRLRDFPETAANPQVTFLPRLLSRPAAEPAA